MPPARRVRLSLAARRLAGVAALAAGAATLALRPAAAATDGPQFVVAPLPDAPVQGTPYNEDVEPGIGIDGAGTIWIGSNIDGNTGKDPRTNPGAGVLTGSDLWRSSDGGRTFQWVSDPFVTNGSSSFGLGGEDSDATVAPEKNSSGFYNVYSTSLWLGASSLAWSQDGGQTFQVMNLGGVPAQDRPWLAADGACTLYLVYHQLPLFLPVVNTYDVCNGSTITSTPVPTINPVSQSALFMQNSAPGLTNAFNKAMVDGWPSSPHRHNVYVPMEACDMQSPADYLQNVVTTAEQIPTCPPGVDTEVEVSTSSDGGSTWTDQVVAVNDNGEQQVWPTSLGVGPDGSVYVAWSDNHHAFTSVSHDGGTTWSPRRRLDTAPVATADYPTVAVGPDGHVDVGFYGSTRSGDTNDSTAMGTPGDPAAAPWRLYLARSTDGGASFGQHQLTGVIHTGVLCTKGSSCSGNGDRNLYDDFGVAVSRVTNLTTIAFDADEPPGSATAAASAVDPYTAYATELPPAAPGSAAGAPAASAAAAGSTRSPAGIPNTSAAPLAGGAGLAAAGALLLGSTLGRRRRS